MICVSMMVLTVCYYPYKVFVDKCLERARTVKEDSDKYNEILLKPWFENDVLAIFYRYDAAGWFKKQAEGLHMRPICH